MTPDELQRELSKMGIVCRIQREEVVVEVCRFCNNDRWNLELNPGRGLFHCWVCNEGGRLDRLLRDWLGQEIVIPVRRSPDRSETTHRPPPPSSFSTTPAHNSALALRYLMRRGIDRDVAAMYGLVVCTDTKHLLAGRLVIPVPDFWTGEILGHIGRTFTNQRPKYLSTLPTRVITGYCGRSPHNPCILVEGFFDGIAVHRGGFQAAVLGGTSAPRVKEFGARLSPLTPVAVMLDGSATEEAQRLRWALAAVRPTAVAVITLPPERDPANFTPSVLQRFIKDEFLTNSVQAGKDPNGEDVIR